MIVAGGNLFGFELTDLAQFIYEKDENVISLYEEDSNQVLRGGYADMDNMGRVIAFVEKPKAVLYPYSVPNFYIIHHNSISLFKEYIDEGNNADANGNFIPYLLDKSTVYGFIFTEPRYDIGTLESYRSDQKFFEENNN